MPPHSCKRWWFLLATYRLLVWSHHGRIKVGELLRFTKRVLPAARLTGSVSSKPHATTHFIQHQILHVLQMVNALVGVASTNIKQKPTTFYTAPNRTLIKMKKFESNCPHKTLSWNSGLQKILILISLIRSQTGIPRTMPAKHSILS